MNWSDIPRLDQPGAEAGPRAVRFREVGTAGLGRLERRGFLAVLATGAMTLSMTLLGWIPLARPARAEEGTEYPDCGGYSDGPGGPLCVGAAYSPSYCGDDNWFKNGCFTKSDGTVDCYEPVAACRAGGDEGRDAWRWEANGFEYRCADGHVYHHGAPNPEFVICNATLTLTSTPEAVPGLGMPALPRVLP